MTCRVALIDYGMGNLFSVQQALEACGAHVILVDSPRQISSADLLVLPGVGAFKDGMRRLKEQNLIGAIQDHARSGRPMLGICLGMQMLLDESEEFGTSKGLGLISGRVVAIPSKDVNGQAHRIPHIGWNELINPDNSPDEWEDSILRGIPLRESMYFVHSFNALPANPRNCLADCYYGGLRISAAIRAGTVYGCQFHPEKSGQRGLQIIRNFLLM
jgi:glutamine amidotransferase